MAHLDCINAKRMADVPSGYIFLDWTEDGVRVSNEAAYTFTSANDGASWLDSRRGPRCE